MNLLKYLFASNLIIFSLNLYSDYSIINKKEVEKRTFKTWGKDSYFYYELISKGSEHKIIKKTYNLNFEKINEEVIYQKESVEKPIYSYRKYDNKEVHGLYFKDKYEFLVLENSVFKTKTEIEKKDKLSKLMLLNAEKYLITTDFSFDIYDLATKKHIGSLDNVTYFTNLDDKIAVWEKREKITDETTSFKLYDFDLNILISANEVLNPKSTFDRVFSFKRVNYIIPKFVKENDYYILLYNYDDMKECFLNIDLSTKYLSHSRQFSFMGYPQFILHKFQNGETVSTFRIDDFATTYIEFAPQKNQLKGNDNCVTKNVDIEGRDTVVGVFEGESTSIKLPSAFYTDMVQTNNRMFFAGFEEGNLIIAELKGKELVSSSTVPLKAKKTPPPTINEINFVNNRMFVEVNINRKTIIMELE